MTPGVAFVIDVIERCQLCGSALGNALPPDVYTPNNSVLTGIEKCVASMTVTAAIVPFNCFIPAMSVRYTDWPVMKLCGALVATIATSACVIPVMSRPEPMGRCPRLLSLLLEPFPSRSGHG